MCSAVYIVINNISVSELSFDNNITLWMNYEIQSLEHEVNVRFRYQCVIRYLSFEKNNIQ